MIRKVANEQLLSGSAASGATQAADDPIARSEV